CARDGGYRNPPFDYW
nr:immunoglobulin heavy chain junction region [Macaca mulatta]